MLPEHLEIIRPQPEFVPNLDPIRPAPRQVAQKLVQVRDEIPAMLVVARIKLRELEHEQPYVPLERLERPHERRREQVRIQEILVRLSRAKTETRQFRESFEGNIVGHLEREL